MSLSSWIYQSHAKETSSYNDDDPPTNLEMDTTEAPQQQQGDGNEHDEQERDGDWIDPIPETSLRVLTIVN
jgi:hypothetical protein